MRMRKLIKEKYEKMDIFTIQEYIKLIKGKFQVALAKQLNLLRVSAPIFVTQKSGFQDNLKGDERGVDFDIAKNGEVLEIVQSLAKWKRFALKQYNFTMYKGLYTDMTAIRRDDEVDQLHSIYVDQWDWEKIISSGDRTLKYLRYTVRKIVKALAETSRFVNEHGYKKVTVDEHVHFCTSEELLKLYPKLTPKEREYEIVKKYKTVFIMQIGDKLSDGKVHDFRAPDYDDWQLNGDLIVYHEVLDCALELSSMGIRVNKKSLLSQLKKTKKTERLKLQYHKMIMDGKLPLTIGGGIGESRLCQFLLGRAHIGEVQSSYWDKQNLKWCEENGIKLL